MKGRRRPIFNLHRSDKEPKMGHKKNPTSGDRAHTKVMCWCSTPIFSKVGDTKAVSAAYENSMPITAAETRTSSARVLCLQNESENKNLLSSLWYSAQRAAGSLYWINSRTDLERVSIGLLQILLLGIELYAGRVGFCSNKINYTNSLLC